MVAHSALAMTRVPQPETPRASAAAYGAATVEHPVSHHPRVAGITKYGMRNRAGRAFVDLLALRWMRSRSVRTPSLAPRDSRARVGHANEP